MDQTQGWIFLIQYKNTTARTIFLYTDNTNGSNSRLDISHSVRFSIKNTTARTIFLYTDYLVQQLVPNERGQKLRPYL